MFSVVIRVCVCGCDEAAGAGKGAGTLSAKAGSCGAVAAGAGGQGSSWADISKALRILSGSEAMLCFPIVTNSLCASPSSSIETNLMSKNPPVQRVAFLHLYRIRLGLNSSVQWITSSAALVEFALLASSSNCSHSFIPRCRIHLLRTTEHMFYDAWKKSLQMN